MQEHQAPVKPASDFMATTQWSLVRAAGANNVSAARDALAKLCTAYWHPLYAYIRRKGHHEHDAADLTQEFFARLLMRNDLAALEPSRGRFRAFLLAAINHFLANEWRSARTLKRGAGQAPISLDIAAAEQHMASCRAAEKSPEQLFDKRWAETVLERAAKRLQDEFIQDGRENVFRELNTFLSTPADSGDYAEIADRLGLSNSAVAKTVERMRRRYRELVRAEIAQTVTTQDEVEEEMRYLLEVLA
jgi:RNA polymerase sigma-70 factor (ECF subfamily)